MMTPKPASIEHMIEFWDRLCSISHGLALIHGNPASSVTGISVPLGYVGLCEYHRKMSIC